MVSIVIYKTCYTININILSTLNHVKILRYFYEMFISLKSRMKQSIFHQTGLRQLLGKLYKASTPGQSKYLCSKQSSGIMFTLCKHEVQESVVWFIKIKSLLFMNHYLYFLIIVLVYNLQYNTFTKRLYVFLILFTTNSNRKYTIKANGSS